MAHNPRNTLLATGVERLSRSKVYQKRALYKKIAAAKKKPVAAKPAAAPATVKSKTVGGAKNGKTRQVVLQKAPKFYPAEDVAAPKQVRKTSRPAKLRSTITPGTVLIMLAGRFRGKRVVFLKQLSSGMRNARHVGINDVCRLVARDRPVQGERCASAPCQTGLRDGHVDAHQG
jgi:large subunit ribosomal protein L6e